MVQDNGRMSPRAVRHQSALPEISEAEIMMARPIFHSTTAKFRMPDGLLAAAEARARRKGISLSELMRNALRKEVAGDPQ